MNKTLVVTGGTKGIGKAIIKMFWKNGFDVITCARNENDFVVLKDSLPKNPLQKILFFKADVAIKTSVVAFADFIKNNTSQVDVLINNAGYFVPGQIHNEADGTLEDMMNTNLYSAYHLSRELLKIMIPLQKGHIFNICSVASITPYANGGSYCITKYAMLGMSKVLREELKSFQIRVTSVLPGATHTDSWAGSELPEERFIKADDLANLIYATYTLSENSVVEEIIIRPMLGDL